MIIEYILVVLLILVLLYIFWQLKIFRPIYWVSLRYRQEGASSESNRWFYDYIVKKYTKYGIFTIFCDRETGEEAFSYHGDPFKMSWKISNSHIGIKFWGRRPKWMYEEEKTIGYLTEEQINGLSAFKLGKLPEDHSLRQKLMDNMRKSVLDQISYARESSAAPFYHKQAVALLYKGLTAKPWQFENSFALWDGKRGVLLGTETCYKIGVAACASKHFTLEEAKHLYELIYGK